jgi:methyltransferase (TIGR00027 family)
MPDTPPLVRRGMEEGKPSRTAAYVALLRALGDRGVTSASGFRDEAAHVLLPSGWRRALTWLGRGIPRLPARARAGVIAHVDLLVLRALAIDAHLIDALRRGCRQVVILGAGFDSRAHRIDALAGAHVFEVDHPATQAEKRRLDSGLARTCSELTYVACDFERDVLADRLEAAGHRPDEPTFWIWEGVTLYLDDAALDATLSAIAACSARGSTLLVEYHDADAWERLTPFAVARTLLLTVWSEPQIGVRSKSAFHAALERAGLRADEDFGVFEWGATFAGATQPIRMSSARLAVAVPDGSA